MAEFCPECWNKLNGFDDPVESYVLSWERVYVKAVANGNVL